MPRGRPRKVDPKDALETAMMTFWEKGYEHTSMSDLVEATGMAKPGLYANLGDKEEIFKKTLALYDDVMVRPMFEDIENTSLPLKQAFRNALERMMHAERGSGLPNGCMVLNSTFECKPQDKGLTDTIADLHVGRRDAFLERLKNAKQSGELEADADEVALANYFAGQSAAIAVMAQSGVDLAGLEAMIDVSLSVLPDLQPALKSPSA